MRPCSSCTGRVDVIPSCGSRACALAAIPSDHDHAPNAVEVMRKLGGQWPDRELAVTMNRMRCRSPDGQSWTMVRVKALRERLGIAPFDPTVARAETISVDATAQRLGICVGSVHRLIRQGVLPAQQIMPSAPWQVPVAALATEAVQIGVRDVIARRPKNFKALQDVRHTQAARDLTGEMHYDAQSARFAPKDVKRAGERIGAGFPDQGRQALRSFPEVYRLRRDQHPRPGWDHADRTARITSVSRAVETSLPARIVTSPTTSSTPRNRSIATGTNAACSGGIKGSITPERSACRRHAKTCAASIHAAARPPTRSLPAAALRSTPPPLPPQTNAAEVHRGSVRHATVASTHETHCVWTCVQTANLPPAQTPQLGQSPKPPLHARTGSSGRFHPVENVWQFIRENWLSNRVFPSYGNLLDHCCEAWNHLISQPWKIMSIGLRDWAHRS